jgi:hypothetical protein
VLSPDGERTAIGPFVASRGTLTRSSFPSGLTHEGDAVASSDGVAPNRTLVAAVNRAPVTVISVPRHSDWGASPESGVATTGTTGSSVSVAEEAGYGGWTAVSAIVTGSFKPPAGGVK